LFVLFHHLHHLPPLPPPPPFLLPFFFFFFFFFPFSFLCFLCAEGNREWWRARGADGTEGYVPLNYLKLPETEAQTTSATAPSNVYMALWDYDDGDPLHLTFQKKDLITVISKGKDGWWSARHATTNKAR
jgi:hypothetical protein